MLLVSVLFALLIALVSSDGSFISPPEATTSQSTNPANFPVYSVGDTLNLVWNDTYDLVTLIVNQLNSPLTQIDYLPDSSSYQKPLEQ
jgi:hypothetical protein